MHYTQKAGPRGSGYADQQLLAAATQRAVPVAGRRRRRGRGTKNAFDQWLRDFELQASVNAQGEGGNGSAGGDGGDADEGYAAWIAELKECLLQAGVHNRPAALMGDASLLSEATLRDVGALLTGGVDVRVGGLCLQEAGIYTHAEKEQVAANCRRDCYDAAASA